MTNYLTLDQFLVECQQTGDVTLQSHNTSHYVALVKTNQVLRVEYNRGHWTVKPYHKETSGKTLAEAIQKQQENH